VMDRMISACIAADMSPIVLTPFVYGSLYSMRNGVTYANALRELITNKPGAVLVDCIEVLRAYPKGAVLQHDGFHLSQNGHAVVGLAIAQQIISHFQRRQINKTSEGIKEFNKQDGIAKSPQAALGRVAKEPPPSVEQRN